MHDYVAARISDFRRIHAVPEGREFYEAAEMHRPAKRIASPSIPLHLAPTIDSAHAVVVLLFRYLSLSLSIEHIIQMYSNQSTVQQSVYCRLRIYFHLLQGLDAASVAPPFVFIKPRSFQLTAFKRCNLVGWSRISAVLRFKCPFCSCSGK